MACPNRVISVKRSDEVTIVYFRDEPILDFPHACQLGREFGDLLNATDHPRIIVDFRDVEYMGAMVIAELISARRHISERNGSLKLCGMHENIRDIFRLMKVDELFEIHDTREEASQSFKQA